MSVTLRRIRTTFTCICLLVITSVTIILYSTEKLPYLLSSFKACNNRDISTLQSARSQCFSVGFPVPKGVGLGNHLFYYAAVMYVASITGRRPFLLTSGKTLDKAFDLDILREDISKQCPFKPFNHRYIYRYDDSVTYLNKVSPNVTVRLDGYFFSWKYVSPIEDQLRCKLRLRPELTDFVEKFQTSNVPRGWDASALVRVGVHVRRGDFLSKWAVSIGLTVASKQYLSKAMTYFVERYPLVQFIVASNDIAWCQNNIKPSSFDLERVNVTFSKGHSTEQDFALLAGCDNMIMTTGTYGWWASWLANGTTVYYSKFVRRGYDVWRWSRAADHFLPTWIGMK